MRKRIFSVIAILIAGVIAACVGDDPATSSGPDQDAATNDATSNDGGGDSVTPIDSGVDSGNFTPASLPGLVLWLDDESIDLNGTNVTEWQDKSGRANNAFPDTDGGPVAAPSGIAGGAGIGGKEVVHFDGATNYLQLADSASLRWAADFTIAIVERLASSDAALGSGEFLYAKQAAGVSPNPGPTVFASLEAARPSFFGGVDTDHYLSNGPDPALSYDTAHVLRFRWISDATGTGGTMEMRVDDVFATNHLALLPDITAVGSDAFLGVNGVGRNSFFYGDIATVIAINGPTSDTDEALLLAYLKNRYGL